MQGQRRTALEGIRSPLEGRRKAEVTKFLILIFSVSYQTTFLSLKIKPLVFAPLRHKVQFGVNSVKRCLEKVSNPHGISLTTMWEEFMYVLYWQARDLIIR